MTADPARYEVSDDGTHHLVDGRDCYPQRFDAVLPFHPPGLAPVRRGAEAWHIRADGSDAYAHRYMQTFGFYEGLAAVETTSGWCHVEPDGRPTSDERHAWCGNLQHGRVPVRRRDGHYGHLDRRGRPRGRQDWRYAGDFRERAAVVQRGDGLHGHVDLDGAALHDRWFLDLDVFHKGLARARDASGWTHVDRQGRAVYTRRFAAVEPFYNGQARVERDDGAIEVIAPSGRTLHTVREPRVSPLHALSADLVGYWRTSALALAVRTGLVDALPGTVEELARRVGAPADSTRRLLRAMWELRVVEPDGAVWRPTARGGILARHHPRTLADAALEYAGQLAWTDLAEALAGPRPRSRLFDEVAGDPKRRASHHRMLASYAYEDYGPLVPLLPISPGERVVDAGGGTGTLARLIDEARPGADLVVFDLPGVAAGARGPFRAVGGDLFEAWPLEADVVVLARVLHDWDDSDAAVVLAHARAALRAGGRIAVLEMVLDEADPGGALCDLHVLATTGGRERTRGAWRSLLETAGLRLDEVRRGPGFVHVLVARPLAARRSS